jgi:uncharacterized membrane protein YidH (DUF202 family)
MSSASGIDDIENVDPGLAGERTELAWTRTAISFAAVGGVVLRTHPAVGIPILALSPLIWELGRLPGKPGTGHARARHLQLITVVVVAVSLAALVITLMSGW